MTSNVRLMGSAILFLGLAVGLGNAKADLITPLNSSFALTAQSQAGYSNNVVDTNAQSQGSTINTLTVAVSAKSVLRTHQRDSVGDSQRVSHLDHPFKGSGDLHKRWMVGHDW